MSLVKTQVELKKLTTFKVSATASHFLSLNSVNAAVAAIDQIKAYQDKMVLGGGSNVLFVGDYQGLIIYPQLFGIQLIDETEEQVRVSVAASENWHDWVLHSNKKGWYGLENLALIPGTVGAAPVQNIGAYGVEVRQFIHQVECIDLTSGEVLLLTNAQCEFDYRDSFFKRAGQGKYLVTRVEFNLKKQPDLCLSYRPLAEHFKFQDEVSAKGVIDRVCHIRQQKLPNPNELPNAGSFFKNPVVSKEHYEILKRDHPEIVAYPMEEGFKLAAGWLIEQAGYKGMREGDIGVHCEQALVLVNYGEDDGAKIEQLANKIQQGIWNKFKVELEPEVRIEGQDS